MAYIRKTQDEYRIMWFNGEKYEEVCAEFTSKEARARIKEYRINQPGDYKITKHRIKIEAKEE